MRKVNQRHPYVDEGRGQRTPSRQRNDPRLCLRVLCQDDMSQLRDADCLDL